MSVAESGACRDCTMVSSTLRAGRIGQRFHLFERFFGAVRIGIGAARFEPRCERDFKSSPTRIARSCAWLLPSG